MSNKLAQLSPEDMDAYSRLVSTLPDDFGRFPILWTVLVGRLYPKLEDHRAVGRAVRRWQGILARFEQVGLLRCWSEDGVRFAEVTGFQPTGNRYHRTPEPDGSVHVHALPCLPSAIAQLRHIKKVREAEVLSIQYKELRRRRESERGSEEGPRGGPGGVPSSPSSPPSPSSPRINGHPPIPPADAGGDASDFEPVVGTDEPESPNGQAEALRAYWVQLGGHPDRNDRRWIREALRSAYKVEEIKAAIVERAKEELVKAGKFNWDAPWPPPDVADRAPPVAAKSKAAAGDA